MLAYRGQSTQLNEGIVANNEEVAVARMENLTKSTLYHKNIGYNRENLRIALMQGRQLKDQQPSLSVWQQAYTHACRPACKCPCKWYVLSYLPGNLLDSRVGGTSPPVAYHHPVHRVAMWLMQRGNVPRLISWMQSRNACGS